MKRLFGFLILAAFFSMLHAQRVLSLDSCRNMAIANNKSLLIAKERMRKAHYDRKAAFTNFLPDFSATGTYMYFSDEISLLNDGQKSALNHMGTSLQQGLTQAATPHPAYRTDESPVGGFFAAGHTERKTGRYVHGFKPVGQ